MPIKNPKQLLDEAVSIPAKIEARLPAGAPVISTMLIDTAAKLPVLPDFPMEFPDLPVLPELPEMPAQLRGLGGTNRVYVKEASVTPLEQTFTPPQAILGEVKTRRGM